MGSFHVNSINISSMTIPEFDEIDRKEVFIISAQNFRLISIVVCEIYAYIQYPCRCDFVRFSANVKFLAILDASNFCNITNRSL